MCINCPKSNSYEGSFNEILDAQSAIIGEFTCRFVHDVPGSEAFF